MATVARRRAGDVSSGHWEFPLDLWRGYQLRVMQELHAKAQVDQQAMHQQVFDAFQAAQLPQAPVQQQLMPAGGSPFLQAPVPFDPTSLAPPVEPPAFAESVASTGAFDGSPVMPQPQQPMAPQVAPAQPTPQHGFDVWGD